MNNSLKQTVIGVWPLRALAFLVFRPKRFLSDFVYSWMDYRRFRASVSGFHKFLGNESRVDVKSRRPGLLLIAGNGMNAQWCQLWALLAGVFRRKRYATFVLTSRSEPIHNRYFRLFGVQPIYLADLSIRSLPVPASYEAAVARLETFDQFKDFALGDVPMGQIAISTWSRLRATGVIDLTDHTARDEIRAWLRYLYQTFVTSQRLYEEKNIEILFFSEVFMEEYGAFYYGALTRDMNVIRFAGTVRDDAIIVQHLTKESDRTHHASVTPQSWAQIRKYPDSPAVVRELEENFMHRYGDKWALSKRNQPGTQIMSPAKAREILGVQGDRKIAVIFSHILYDTLFFFGEDIFPSYADWFIASVKAACLNPAVQWFVKVHPSNLWRGELEHFFGGKYEEVRLIEKFVGDLPCHVTLVYPDTPISPYTWFQIADYGITVRGTSGIELGALGKTVITAGSGRYEEAGFSINPGSVAEYLQLLASLPDIPETTEKQRQMGARFAYATFCMKPFTLDFLRPAIRAGKTRIFSSEDLVYLGNFPKRVSDMPKSIQRFMAWSMDRDSIDFLNEWPHNDE